MEFSLILVLLTAVCTGTATKFGGVVDRVAELGSKLVLSCPRDVRAIDMVWKENQKDFVPREGYSVKESKSAVWATTLTVDRLQESDNGTIFSCIATFPDGRIGGVNIRYAVLTHDQLPRGYPMIESTQSDSGFRRASPGDVVRLPCYVTGDPKPHVAWYKDSAQIDRNDKRYSVGSSNELFIRHVGPEDNGEYECVAWNTHGKAYSRPLALHVRKSQPFLYTCFVNFVATHILAVALLAVGAAVRFLFKKNSSAAPPMIEQLPANGVDESDNDWDSCSS